MSIQEEVQLLRAEMRSLRQEVALYKRSWEQQKARAERLEQVTHELRIQVKLVTKKNAELAAKLETTDAHKNKLAGMIFKTNVKSEGEKKGRKRGGQPGHKGHGRKKPIQVDQEKEVHLSHCPDCGTEVEETTTTYERIVEDVPDPRKMVTCYHIQRQWCCRCNKEVRAVPIGTLAGFRIGLQLIVWILFHKYRLRTPLNKMEEALKEQYDINLSQGAIQHILHRLKKRFGKKYEKIIKHIQNCKVKHGDETGWRVEGINGWCWLFSSKRASLYTIEETRGKGVPDAVLGKNPKGVLVRDDCPSYAHLEMGQQSCWVHLLRVSREAKERGSASEEVIVLHAYLKKMFQELKEIVGSPFDQSIRDQAYSQYVKKLTRIQKKTYQNADTQRVQTRIQNQGANLLTALKHNGVPLTNNHAEQQIRPMVVTRKISGGSRSPKGAATHAVNMSISQTLLLEGKSFITGVKELLRLPAHQYALEKTE
jgi:transposase